MARIDAHTLLSLLQSLDEQLRSPQKLCIIGSCALLLLGHQARSTADIDIWLPASNFDSDEMQTACHAVGLRFDPREDDPGDTAFLQIVHAGVVELPAYLNKRWSTGEASSVAWQGKYLTILIPPPAILIASKLARCEERDLHDSVWLLRHTVTTESAVRAAAKKMPRSVREAAVENIVLLSVAAAA